MSEKSIDKIFNDLNIVDIEKCSELPEHVDRVYHLAGYSRIEQSFEDVKQVWHSNMNGTFAVLEFCRSKNAKIVYGASSTIFSDEGKDLAPYTWTKANALNLVERYGDWYGTQYAVAYFYNVYGPRQIKKGRYRYLHCN